MHRITVKLFAHLRQGRFVCRDMDIAPETTVARIVEQLGINQEEVGVTMINSRHCTLDATPQEGDTLAIFPLVGGG